MKLFTYSIFSIFLFCFSAQSQTYYERTYGGTSHDEAYAIEVTSDGGCIVTGRSQILNGVSDFDIFLLKLDASGNQEWFKVIPNTGNDIGRGVVQTPDLGYVVCAELAVSGGVDCFLIKFDMDGAVLWQQRYHASTFDRPNYLAIAADGGFMISGYRESSVGSGVDAYVLKTDANGVLQWSRGYDAGNNETHYGFAETTDGYVLAGYIQGFGAGSASGIISKIDLNGNLLWSEVLSGTAGFNGFYCNRSYNSSYFAVRKKENGFTGGREVWVYKYNASNTGSTPVWSKAYGTPTTEEEAYGLAHNSLGNFAVAGAVVNAVTGNNALLFSCDDNGNLLWSRVYGGDGDDRLMNVRATGTDGFVACGFSSSTGAGNNDIYIIKVDNNGNASASCNYYGPTFTESSFTPAKITVSPTTINYTNTNVVSSSIQSPVISISSNCSTLPVTYVSFEIKRSNKNRQLTWITGSEKDASHFVVERSEDGVHFQAIGQVAATNNRNGSIYQYLDLQPQIQDYYYRLNQVDINGAASLSIIRFVAASEEEESYSLYPNPTSDKVILKMKATENLNSPVLLKIYSAFQKEVIVVHTTRAFLTEGVELSLKDLASGFYVLHVSSSELEFSTPLIKE